MKTFTCISRKGGVGKTTLAFNIAMGLPYVLANADITGMRDSPRVLAVDLDPQRDLTKNFIGEDVVNAGEIKSNLYDFLTCDMSESALMSCVHNTRLCDVIPGCTLKGDVLALLTENPLLLRERLSIISDRYDACIIDLPPARDAVSFGALLASDYAIPCTDINPRGADGVKDTMIDINGVSNEFGINVRVPFIAVKADPAELYSDADLLWLKKRLSYTGSAVLLLQFDSRLLRDTVIYNQLVYYFPRKKLTRVLAQICVHLVVNYLGDNLRDPGYPPFTSFYDIEREAHKERQIARTLKERLIDSGQENKSLQRKKASEKRGD